GARGPGPGRARLRRALPLRGRRAHGPREHRRAAREGPCFSRRARSAQTQGRQLRDPQLAGGGWCSGRARYELALLYARLSHAGTHRHRTLLRTMELTGPPYRADHVGSLLRPPELRKAHEEALAGRFHAEELRALQDRSI